MSERLNFVITGASGDIGSAVAQYLDTLHDTNLILVSRNGSLPQLRSRSASLTGIDLTREADVAKLKDAVDSLFRSPFSLVHCVGAFWHHKPLIRTEFEELRQMIESHYLTLCSTVWALLPSMIARGGGRIVALSCNSVGYNYPDMAPFTSAKAAVESFIKSISNEYAPYGIAANAIALPTIKTQKVVVAKAQGDHANYVSSQELAELIAQTIAPASPILNGNIIKVFRHSPTFFNKSYFERNPRTIPIKDGED